MVKRTKVLRIGPFWPVQHTPSLAPPSCLVRSTGNIDLQFTNITSHNRNPTLTLTQTRAERHATDLWQAVPPPPPPFSRSLESTPVNSNKGFDPCQQSSDRANSVRLSIVTCLLLLLGPSDSDASLVGENLLGGDAVWCPVGAATSPVVPALVDLKFNFRIRKKFRCAEMREKQTLQNRGVKGKEN